MWDIASAELGSPADRELERLIVAGEWDKARRYQAANEPADIRVWRAVRCRTGEICILFVVLTDEIWEEDRNGPTRPLPVESSQQLVNLIAGRWRQWPR